VAVEAAHRAGQLALRYYASEFQVEWKQDHSPVTVADREAETLIRQTLLASFPGDGFLGEEHGDSPGTSGFRWVIDPIDGTRSFVRHIPLWGTIIGLEYRGEPIAGVVEMPALGEAYRALRGDGAFRNNQRISVSKTAELSQSMLFYTGLSYFLKAGRSEEFLRLAAQTDRQRGYGDVYGFMLVAQGSGEVIVEHGVHVWDVTGVLPLIEEAGGRFTAWDGSRTVLRPDVVASNGQVHDQVLRLLGGK
jgi:histidinol-phosphatase